MHGRQRNLELVAQRKERWDRLDKSTRLRDEVPNLQTLHFEVTGRRGRAPLLETRHTRRFVLDQAPAIFELRCTDTACTGGGHDLTQKVLAQLRKSNVSFELDDPCRGTCGRSLHVVVVAGYR